MPSGFAKTDITDITPSKTLSVGVQPPTVFNFYFLSFCGAQMLDYSDAVTLLDFYGLFPILPIALKSVRKHFCFLLGDIPDLQETIWGNQQGAGTNQEVHLAARAPARVTVADVVTRGAFRVGPRPVEGRPHLPTGGLV